MIPISALLMDSDKVDLDKCPFGLGHKCSECMAWVNVAFSEQGPRVWSNGFCLRMLPGNVDWDLAEPLDRRLTLKLMAENNT